MAKKSIPVVARKALTHHGREIAEGEAFEVTPIEGAALVYQHKALFASDARAKPLRRRRREYQRRDLVPEQP